MIKKKLSKSQKDTLKELRDIGVPLSKAKRWVLRRVTVRGRIKKKR